MFISNIFESVEGEGIFCGTYTKFIRFQGCSLNCKWCDTKEAQVHGKGVPITHRNIINILGSSLHRVSITGGNPMEQNPFEMNEFLISLNEATSFINIEHPGIWLNEEIENDFLKRVYSVSFDIKPPSSKIRADLVAHAKETIAYIKANPRKKTQLKCVVDTDEDLEWFISLFDKSLIELCVPIFLQVCDSKNPSMANKIIEQMRKANLPVQARLGYQMHKAIGVE